MPEPMLVTLAEDPAAPVVVEWMDTVAEPGAPGSLTERIVAAGVATTVVATGAGGTEALARRGRESVPRAMVFVVSLHLLAEPEDGEQ